MKYILLCIISITYAWANKLQIPAILPKNSSQLVIVDQIHESMAVVTAYQKTAFGWQQALAPVPADIGSNGIAPLGHKKEGDKKTPAGLYKLGPAYGTQPLALKMDYRYVTTADKFIDDPQSKEYNTWVAGSTNAKSYEIMDRTDNIYNIGVVVNYNMHPIVAGAGSAIFMHIWYGPNIGTTGCVAMDEKNLLKLLRWLDKKQNPYILIKSTQQIQTPIASQRTSPTSL